jgi:hypothetical protein
MNAVEQWAYKILSQQTKKKMPKTKFTSLSEKQPLKLEICTLIVA